MSLQNIFLDEACAGAMSDERLLAAMARFEAALARATAPAAEAEVIARVCASAKFDTVALARDARRAGALTIPFVKRLTEQVAAVSPDAARWVHFGATSQDVIDTAVVLCLKDASKRILELSKRLGDAAAALAQKHAGTPMVSRTLLQPATPATFGWKAAVWLSLVARSHAAFRAAVPGHLQLGGAGGTLSAYGDKGNTVAAAMAKELGLGVAPITWHSARDAFARLGAEAAILAGGSGKIARDVSLMMQPEVGEAFEPSGEGKGGSSALPHKRNPVGCLSALEATQRAPGLAATLLSQLAPEHERGLGQWQSQFFTLRELLGSAASGLAAMAEVLEGLRVEPAAMLANLERTKGLVYSEAVSLRLSAALGKSAAHALTEKLCAEAVRGGITLAEALSRNAEAAKLVPESERAALFDPKAHTGSSATMIDGALRLWKETNAIRTG
jgi:3-carboxy-cis,cis-muconate cycloisomerase